MDDRLSKRFSVQTLFDRDDSTTFNRVAATTLSGVANTDPSLTGLFIANSTTVANGRCKLTGEPIFSGYTVDPSLPVNLQPHFNLNAFRRPLPNGSVGNFGNAPIGVLRNPSWSNWDFTLARRVPIQLGHAHLRIQLQVYNLFNQVAFTTLNATYLFSDKGNISPDTGHYTQTTNPRNVELTARVDF